MPYMSELNGPGSPGRVKKEYVQEPGLANWG